MFWSKQPEVIVVGAGPVGLVTALTLARRDVRVEVVDEAWRRAAHAYALALHPSSVKLLDTLGMVEGILEKCYRVRTVGLYDEAERRAEVNVSEIPEDFSFIAVLGQNHLEGLLAQALKERGVTVQWNHRLARLDSGTDSARLTVDRLDKESVGYGISMTEWAVQSSRDLDVPFVIGCDGSKSLVRRQMGIAFPEVAAAEHYAVFEFSTNYDFDHDMRMMFQPDSASVVWPLPDRRCRFSFQLPEYDEPDDERVKNRLLVEVGSDRYPNLGDEDLQRLLRERAPWFDGRVEDIRWRLVVRFERRLAESFGANRVWLAGDSAHLASPVGIQSMNVGLQEGFELGNLVADVLQGRRSPADVASFGASRRLEWERLLGLKPGLVAGPTVSDWVGRFGRSVVASLPASGNDLKSLAGQLGFVG